MKTKEIFFGKQWSNIGLWLFIIIAFCAGAGLLKYWQIFFIGVMIMINEIYLIKFMREEY